MASETAAEDAVDRKVDGDKVPAGEERDAIASKSAADDKTIGEREIRAKPSYSSIISHRGALKRGWKHWQRLSCVALALALYWLIGVLVMMYNEKTGFPRRHWNLYEATYWCVASLIGIGYGDFAPTHNTTKIFVIFYLVVGVVLTTWTVTTSALRDLEWEYEAYKDDVGEITDRAREKSAKFMKLRFKKKQRSSARHSIAWITHEAYVGENSSSSKFAEFFSSWDWPGVLVSMTSSIVLLLLGTFALKSLEGGTTFGYLNSFYFSAVTMGHVGYGEFSPKKESSIIFLIFFQLLCWAFFVVVLGKIGAASLEKEHVWQLNFWGVKMEQSGENTQKHIHYMECSEEELLAKRRKYIARYEEMRALQEAEDPVVEERTWRDRRCCCCTAGTFAADVSRRSLYGLFG